MSDLYAPVSGEVVKVNALRETPKLLNWDAFGEGWVVTLSLIDVSELDALMDATAYANGIGASLTI